MVKASILTIERAVLEEIIKDPQALQRPPVVAQENPPGVHSAKDMVLLLPPSPTCHLLTVATDEIFPESRLDKSSRL